MKKGLIGNTCLIITLCGCLHFGSTIAQSETHYTKEENMQWWREARFGMFIHWGIWVPFLSRKKASMILSCIR